MKEISEKRNPLYPGSQPENFHSSAQFILACLMWQGIWFLMCLVTIVFLMLIFNDFNVCLVLIGSQFFLMCLVSIVSHVYLQCFARLPSIVSHFYHQLFFMWLVSLVFHGLFDAFLCLYARNIMSIFNCFSFLSSMVFHIFSSKNIYILNWYSFNCFSCLSSCLSLMVSHDQLVYHA